MKNGKYTGAQLNKSLIKYAWFKDDRWHREDGSAVEWSDGDKEWYINGQLHRLDGPACEYANGDKQWWINGQLHRLDGPAIENSNGYKEWWYDDELIDCQSQEEFERIINLISFK